MPGFYTGLTISHSVRQPIGVFEIPSWQSIDPDPAYPVIWQLFSLSPARAKLVPDQLAATV